MSCSHNKSSEKKVDIDYFGLNFSAKMEVCDDCGAFLWTQETKELLNVWLAEQKTQHRDHFVIQPSLSSHSRNCLEEIAKSHPGIQLSALIRAMTLVFLHFMEEPQYSELFESVTTSKIYESFSHGEKHVAKVQFSPSGMLDVHSWAKLLHMKPSKVVEEAVYRITSIHVDTNPELRKFWESCILPQISLILKSAS